MTSQMQDSRDRFMSAVHFHLFITTWTMATLPCLRIICIVLLVPTRDISRYYLGDCGRAHFFKMTRPSRTDWYGKYSFVPNSALSPVPILTGV
jgi:hypothetical protein